MLVQRTKPLEKSSSFVKRIRGELFKLHLNYVDSFKELFKILKHLNVFGDFRT